MELSDFWQIVQNILAYPLFTIKQTTVTPSSILLLLVVMLGVLVISKVFINSILKRILSRTRLASGVQYTLTRIAHYILFTIGAVFAFQIVGIDMSGLLVLFGFLSVGIGFGLQNVTSNFISGLILLFERPIAVGDRVLVGGVEGDVQEIRMRATVVRTPQNVSIIVPNSEFIVAQVVNWSHLDPTMRLDIEVGVSYNSDLDAVIKSLHEVAEECDVILKEPKAEVLLTAFGDSAWNMQLRVWLEDPKRHWQIRSALHCAIVRKFRENNIEIPFPQRDLHVRSPLPVPIHSAPNNQK